MDTDSESALHPEKPSLVPKPEPERTEEGNGASFAKIAGWLKLADTVLLKRAGRRVAEPARAQIPTNRSEPSKHA
jgi:hypothetical protein